MTTLDRRTLQAGVAGLILAAVAAAPAQATFTQEPGSPFGVGTNPYGVLVADFNADARPDAVAINGTSSTVSVLLRQPAGGFAQETGSPLTVGTGPNFGAVADFNGDARPDVAVANYVSDNVSVLLRQPGGSFANELGSPFAATKAAAVAAADFNGDGRPDLAVPNYLGGGVTVLLRKAGGGFTAEASAPTGVNPRNLASADFNGDGRPDLAVTNFTSGTVTILLRKPSGGFEQEPGSPVKVGTQPAGIIASDLDGDGRTDLAVADFGSDDITLLARRGNGFTPLPGSPIAAGARPVGLAAADFDRDGRTDLAITNNNGSASSVTVLLRRADGSYAHDPTSPVPAANGAYGVAVADFNADGRPDLAVSNDGSGNLSILLNTTPEPVVAGPPSVPPPAPAPVPAATPAPAVVVPAIAARLVLSWSVTAGAVKLNSAILRDAPAGATVRLVCASCRIRQTLTTRRAGLTLSRLAGVRLRRGAGFSVAITKAGYTGQYTSRTVKAYGRSRAALRRAARAPFTETRRCIPVGKTAPAARC